MRSAVAAGKLLEDDPGCATGDATPWRRTNWTTLAAAVARHAAADGAHDTATSDLTLYRTSAPTDLAAVVYVPSLCVVAQGSKEVVLAGESYRYDPAQCLLVSVDLPVSARVVEASAARPCLMVRVTLDTAVVGEFLADGLTDPPPGPPARGLAVTPMEPPLARRRRPPRGPARHARGTSARSPRSCSGRSPTGCSPARRGAAPADRRGRRPGAPDRPGHPLAEGPLRRPAPGRGAGEAGADEPVGVPPALQGGDGAEPAPVPEAAAAPGGPAADARGRDWTRPRRRTGSGTRARRSSAASTGGCSAHRPDRTWPC